MVSGVLRFSLGTPVVRKKRCGSRLVGCLCQTPSLMHSCVGDLVRISPAIPRHLWGFRRTFNIRLE